MTRTLTRDGFARQFREFEHTTWKLEVRDRYDVSSEREEFEYWLRTGDLSLEEKHARTSPWHRNVRDARKAGKLWQRVRVVSEPLSDYIRWEHAATRFNVEAGEDIRWLTRCHPAVEKLPLRDFWLFDSRWVCVVHFNEDDTPTGTRPSTIRRRSPSTASGVTSPGTTPSPTASTLQGNQNPMRRNG